jgi:hypothetical protein
MIRKALLLLIALVALSPSFGQQNISDFWTIFSNDFKDSSLAVNVARKYSQFDSISKVLLKKYDTQTGTYNFDAAAQRLSKLKTSKDTNKLSQSYRLLFHNYYTAFEDHSSILANTNHKYAVSFNNDLVYHTISSGKPELTQFALAQSVSDLDYSLASLDDSKFLPGLNYEKEKCVYDIAMSDRYFDDMNFEVYLFNDICYGWINDNFKIAKVRFGYLPVKKEYVPLSENLKSYLNTLMQTEYRNGYIYRMSSNSFQNVFLSFKVCSSLKLRKGVPWYITVFYKGCLHYINTVDPCDVNKTIQVSYPTN